MTAQIKELSFLGSLAENSSFYLRRWSKLILPVFSDRPRMLVAAVINRIALDFFGSFAP
ncbi:hypothetical protein [Rhabdaerophilum sp.]|uniref:hypothetical protein n=1 Tax=Rhabdaerophilum sp. TaxID=2717341 RepID=UPI0038D4757A